MYSLSVPSQCDTFDVVDVHFQVGNRLVKVIGNWICRSVQILAFSPTYRTTYDMDLGDDGLPHCYYTVLTSQPIQLADKRRRS